MEEDIEIIEELIKAAKDYNQYEGNKYYKSIENLINRNKELEEYQHKVNEILNVDTDNLDNILIKNNQEGLKKCVTQFRNQVEELEKEKLSKSGIYKIGIDFDNDYIPKSKVREKIEELEKFIESKRILPVDIIEDQNRNVKWKIEALQELLEGDDK